MMRPCRPAPVLPILAVTVLVGLVAGGPAVAMDLVPGGYGVADPDAMQAGQGNEARVGTTGSVAGLTFDFTPRAIGSLINPSMLDPSTEAAGQQPLSLTLGVQNRYAEGLRLGSVGLVEPSTEATHGLALGGAFDINDWQLTGSYGRTNLMGEAADVFAAGIGYGPMSARLVYGHVPRTTGPSGDVLMFSTDLAAWSWLTLEGDVAVSDSLAEEPLTVGRVGLRLNF
jgi:hypothetical protein